MNMMVKQPRLADSEVDPFTWVLLAEEAFEQRRNGAAEALIEEAFRAYDDRQNAHLPSSSSALIEIASTDPQPFA